jgi:hypothetical protein
MQHAMQPKEYLKEEYSRKKSKQKYAALKFIYKAEI